MRHSFAVRHPNSFTATMAPSSFRWNMYTPPCACIGRGGEDRGQWDESSAILACVLVCVCVCCCAADLIIIDRLDL